MGKKKSIGLPGGPNEFLQDITQYISVEGYKRYSDDLNNPFNIIDSGNITMEDVDFPVMGIDNLGNSQMMQPGMNYQFPGDQVFEVPMAQTGIEVPKRQGVRDNGDGSVSTHLMATETLDGINWVSFPTLFQDPDGTWIDMSTKPWKEAYKEAERRGELIDFGTDKESAIKFGKGSWKPKAQYGDETVQEEFEIDDRTGKINTRKGYDEGKLFEFAKDKYEKIDTQKQKDDLLYKLSTPAFRERYKKNIFNISGENLSDEELTSRINSQIDFTAAGPDFAVKMPFVTHSSNKGYKRGITPFIYPFSSSQELDYRNARGLYQKNFNIDYPDGSTPDFPEFDQYSYLIQLADKRDPYIMGERDVVPFDKEKGTIVHEYAHSYNTENSPLFEPEGEDFTVVDKGNTWERIPGKKYKNWLSNLFGEDYFTQEGQKYGSWAMKPWEISSVRSENEQSLKNANIWDNTKGEFGEGNLNKMLSSRRFNPESAARMHLDKLGYSELERIQYGIKRLKREQGDLNDEIAYARPGSRNNDFIINNIINSEYEPSMDMDTFNTIFNSSQNDLKDKQKYSDYNSLLEDYNGTNKRKKKIATKVLDVIYSGVKNKLNEGYTEKEINLQNTFDEKKKEVLPKMKMYFNEIAVNNSDQPEMAQYGGALPTAQKGREQATISAYEEPAWYEKAADYLANPFTSFGYSVRGEDIPDGLDVNNPNRNNFDMVVDILNPFAWYQYGENAAQDFKEEEYLNATFNTLGALPFIPASLVAAKNLKTPLQKIAANTSRSMSNANTNVKGGIPSVRPNWSKWNKEIPNNKSLMEEYNAIEKIGKADGTWMKNPDGSMFKGTPEQWVQIRSSNYKKAFPNALLDDSGFPLINYHGSGSKFDIFDESKFYSGEYGKGVYTSTDKEAILKSYANPNKNRTKKIAGKSGTDKPTANLYELYINAKNPLTTDDILDYRNFGKIMDNLPSLADWKASDLGKRLIKQNQWLKTDDDIISFIKTNFPRNPVKESFIDQGGDFLRAIDSPLQEGVTPFNNQMKSSIGNNGMFDMTDPNIYKQKGGESLEEYQDKGEVEKNLDAINKQLAKKTYNPYRDIDEKSQKRRTELTDAINFIVNDQGGDENLRDLLIMTAFMENSYGANADAYGRDYTRGPMSIDDIAYKHMFEMRKGANDYTASQKKYIDWFDSMGYDIEHMDEHLRNDIKANVAASRYQYGTNKNPLPSSKDPKALYNYYMDTYNRTDKNHYDRFLKGYNEFIGKKEFGGSINKYLTYKKFMNGGYTGNDKIEAEKIYDKLNRMHYRDAKQRGLSPQNYIMTNLLGNS